MQIQQSVHTLRSYFARLTTTRSRGKPLRLHDTFRNAETAAPAVLQSAVGLNKDPDQNCTGSRWNDHFLIGPSFQQRAIGNQNDRLVSPENAREPHPAQTQGTDRQINSQVPGGTADDFTVHADSFYGMGALDAANDRADDNSNGRCKFRRATIGDAYRVTGQASDYVTLGLGSQTVDVTAGNDVIYALGDGGEPSPAQSDGLAGRVSSRVYPTNAVETNRVGQRRNTTTMRPLLKARDEALAESLNEHAPWHSMRYFHRRRMLTRTARSL